MTAKKTYIASAFLAFSISAMAQNPVAVGSGSYAEYTPLFKSKTDQHGGDKSRFMETRHIYVNPECEGQPLPTNDWWTYMLVDAYSGVLWSYPQVVKAEGYGIFVAHPNHWSSDGCEMKWDTKITVKGKKFRPDHADAWDWSDWHVKMRLADGEKSMDVTMAQGMPFTWIEPDNLDLLINIADGTLSDCHGNAIELPYEGNRMAVTIGSDVYGLYMPEGTVVDYADEGDISLSFTSHTPQYLSIAILPATDCLDEYAYYAPVVPRATTVDWSYDETSGIMTSSWRIDSENLNGDANLSVMQGFLPHHYKNSITKPSFGDITYATPRGLMKIATGNEFVTSYSFSGILPWFAAPGTHDNIDNPYNRERMKQIITDYAKSGGFGADTYWGGKGLTQMALYMTFAKEMGETELFEMCRNRLRTVMEDWLTYTPGEKQRFFARYDRWGALVGYDTSYDSDTFNDHHFHYGYFTYAGALLAMVDEDFRQRYGEMLRLIAKDYANWERDDHRFPLFRTFTPWSGHSYAGGLGNAGNGNGQESTSEAMQGWGGIYLLGVALGDKAMRDAGIFGWVTESKGVAEYWFDRDHQNTANGLYTKPWCTNLTAAGIGWWTWFSGDPVWMHSIQWMPISPCLDYLSEDLDFARWDYEKMWESKEIGGWVTGNLADGESALSKDSGLGNVVLSYQQRFDAPAVAKIFDEMWDANQNVARAIDTGGITYYITHSHLTYGDRDFAVHADTPTASAYHNNGSYTYVAFNPDSSERMVTFYREGVIVASFKVPAHSFTVYTSAPEAVAVVIDKPSSLTIEPHSAIALSGKVIDQYGATIDGITPEWTCTSGGTITPDGVFTAGSGSIDNCMVTATYGNLSTTLSLRIGNKPVATDIAITPTTEYAEVGSTVEFTLKASDQYGDAIYLPRSWVIEKDGVAITSDSILCTTTPGIYTIKAITAEKTLTHSIYITPKMPNLALGKTVTASSEENAGTLKGNAVDGNPSTRWGSEHTDNEWLAVDLGATMYVDAVSCLWEAAYASSYEVQTSDNGTEWTTAAIATGAANATVTTDIRQNTRHIRIKGISRATTYGYSLYELQVTGIDPNNDASALLGLDIVSPKTLVKAGESYALSAKGFDGVGNAMEMSNVAWNITEGDGTITAEGLYMPEGYGIAKVTATAQGLSVSREFIVEEAITARTIEMSPALAEITPGESLTFEICAYDQFSVEINSPEVTFSCADHPEWLSGATFTPMTTGHFEVTATIGSLSTTAQITVADFSDVNLALNKKVYASSYEDNSTLPQFAVDGDLSTRWGSSFEDNQFLVVDLGDIYVLNNVMIDWNSGAWATAYRIEVSKDEDKWTKVVETEGVASGKAVHQLEAVAGRYVRIYCTTRANGYGSCINELSVYGSAVYTNPTPTTIRVIPSTEQTLCVGDKMKMQAVVIDQYGIDCTTDNSPTWSVDGDAVTIATDGMVTAVKEGTATVKAHCGTLTASIAVVVRPERYIAGLQIEPGIIEMEVNASKAIVAHITDQYGEVMDLTPSWSIPQGLTIAEGILTATAVGEYTLTASYADFTATAKVTVIPTLTENIALKKTIKGSHSEGILSAANDGNAGTRWISNAESNEAAWIEIDLGDTYHILRSNILWERAAAGDYQLLVSDDGATWTTVMEVSGLNDTGADRTDETSTDAYGRYVRLNMTKRATAWAYSIWEWQLFGTLNKGGNPSGMISINDVEATPRIITTCNQVKVIGDAVAVKIYNTAGTMITYAKGACCIALTPGLYIVVVESNTSTICRKVTLH